MKSNWKSYLTVVPVEMLHHKSWENEWP